MFTSGPFVQSKRRRQFLEYVVSETLSGRGERLKGYSIALEVFGRRASFDAASDSIVRVEAARLREKLGEYYATDGRYDPVRIVLPKGSYTPVISWRQGVEGFRQQTVNGLSREAELYGTQDIDSYRELLHGLRDFWVYTRASCAQAQLHFLSAVEFDPKHAAAHMWLARTLVWQCCMNWVPDTHAAIQGAHEHSRRSVELDNTSSLARSILAKVWLCLGEGEKALAEGYGACTMDPNAPDAKMFLSFVLAAMGKGEMALRVMEVAMLQSPHPTSYYYETLGLCHFARGDYESAKAAFLDGIEVNPAYMPCHYELGVVYGVLGCVEQAQTEAATVKSDWAAVATNFIFDPSLATIYLRGAKTAGLV